MHLRHQAREAVLPYTPAPVMPRRAKGEELSTMRRFLLFCTSAFFLVQACVLPAPAAKEEWVTYGNARFGYSVEYPDIFTVLEEPDNGDGIWLKTEGDTYALTISGGFNVLGEDGETRLQARIREAAHIVPGSDGAGPGWYRVIYSDDGGRKGKERRFHEYGILDGENWASFILVYPLEEVARFSAAAARMEKSLALPSSGEGEDGGAFRPDAYTLRDGRVFLDEKALDCEVYEIPAGLDNGITHWAVTGKEFSEDVTQEETGVWFFGPEGMVVTFIPLDSGNEYRDLLWSPAGDRLVLARGSGTRPDLFFDVFGEGMEKIAEFSGLRGEAAWLDDGMRFVFTRIDDTREGAVFPGLSYGLKVSAVLYDSAVEETIPLKEADETRNYTFLSVSPDGMDIRIVETSVLSPGHWADTEKWKEREITVPVPAAG